MSFSTTSILETPLKGQILGALEYAEHLQKTRDIPFTLKEIAEVLNCGANYVGQIKRQRDEELKVTSDTTTRGSKRRTRPTQKELAEKAGCSTATISKVLKKQHPYDDICRSGGHCSKSRARVWVVGRNPNYKPGQ